MKLFLVKSHQWSNYLLCMLSRQELFFSSWFMLKCTCWFESPICHELNCPLCLLIYLYFSALWILNFFLFFFFFFFGTYGTLFILLDYNKINNLDLDILIRCIYNFILKRINQLTRFKILNLSNNYFWLHYKKTRQSGIIMFESGPFIRRDSTELNFGQSRWRVDIQQKD